MHKNGEIKFCAVFILNNENMLLRRSKIDAFPFSLKLSPSLAQTHVFVLNYFIYSEHPIAFQNLFCSCEGVFYLGEISHLRPALWLDADLH